jgi:hypothetical protein
VREPPPRRRPGEARPLGAPPWQQAAPPEDAPAPEARRPTPPEPEPSEPAPPAERDPNLETARLVALEMALAGHSRADVRRHLRDDFGIAKPEPVLDAVFGRD